MSAGDGPELGDRVADRSERREQNTGPSTSGGESSKDVVQVMLDEMTDSEKEAARLLKHARKCGFARIKGVGGLTQVDHVMRSYRILLGRPNKSFDVDVSLGETMNVSRKHGEIFYDFEKKGFFLKVLGKNGIQVDGTLVSPSGDEGGVVPLSSKTWLNVTNSDEDRVVFLLPKRRRKFKRRNEQGDEEDNQEEDQEEDKADGHEEDEEDRDDRDEPPAKKSKEKNGK